MKALMCMTVLSFHNLCTFYYVRYQKVRIQAFSNVNLIVSLLIFLRSAWYLLC